MCKYFYFLIILVGGSCNAIKQSSNKKNDNMNLEVLSICEYKNVFSFKCLSASNRDTLFVVSFKKNINNGCNANEADVGPLTIVETGRQYVFKLQILRTRVSTMEQLGRFIIIGSDTLWQGPSNISPPHYYVAQNVVGLQCWECLEAYSEQ